MSQHTIQVTGTVLKGSQLGRTLGFPTANLDVAALLSQSTSVKMGVYAARVTWQGQTWLAAVYFGPRFDLPDKPLVLEAHIIDFQQDLYSQTITVELLHWLRPPKQFASQSAVIEQIQADVRATRLFFADLC